MYDIAMPEQDIEPAIHEFARQRVKWFLDVATPDMITCMGGGERVMRSCLRHAAAAADALRLPPRKRLERTVAQWSELLADDAPSATPDDSDDAVIIAELTHMLQTRVAEIDAALSSGDVDGAFSLLRNITVTRDGEGQPASVAVPDNLDPESAFWLDLDRNQDN
jgi:hypothetical protein